MFARIGFIDCIIFGMLGFVPLTAMAQSEIADVDKSSHADMHAALDTPSYSDGQYTNPVPWHQQFTFELQNKPNGSEIIPSHRDELVLSFNGPGKWSLSFDLSSGSKESVLPREQISAGAFYQVTPNFTIGGQVSLGADELEDSSTWDEKIFEAGIRLESAFKF